MNRKSLVVTASTDDPVVATADARAYLRAPSADDALVADHVAAATEAIKQYLRVGLQTETLELTMDRFGDCDPDERILSLGAGVHEYPVSYMAGGYSHIDLPFAPVASVTSIKVYDRADAETTVAPTVYGVARERVYLKDGQVWPVSLRDYAGVKITYVAGYGAANVPAPIVEAVKACTQALYEGCDVSDAIGGKRALLAPYKRLDELPW